MHLLKKDRLYSYPVKLIDPSLLKKICADPAICNDYQLLCIIRGDDCFIYTSDIVPESNDELIFISQANNVNGLPVIIG